MEHSNETLAQPLLQQNREDDTPTPDEEEDCKNKKKSCCLCIQLFRTYDTGFLLALGLQYFNAGTQVMIDVAFLQIFKNTFNLEPSETQTLEAYIALPWAPKIIYGIITDTFPICKSRKRSYLILMGLIQVIFALIIAFFPESSAGLVCFCGVMIYWAQAFMDVVVDGLMVCQQRIEPETGSEKL